MATACNILYDNSNWNVRNTVNAQLGRSVKLAGKDASKVTAEFIKWMDSLGHGSFVLRFDATQADKDSAVAESQRMFLNDVEDHLVRLRAKSSLKFSVDQAMKEIRNHLSGNDETGDDKADTDNESLTNDEVEDKNASNLERHFLEFYGHSAYDITESLKQTFRDRFTSAAWWDARTGDVPIKTRYLLNGSIKQMKSDLFRTIVEYMKREYPNDKAIQDLLPDMYRQDQGRTLYASNYARAMGLFYSRVAMSTDNGKSFRDDLVSLNMRRMIGEERSGKQDMYRDMVGKLLSDTTVMDFDENGKPITISDAFRNYLAKRDYTQFRRVNGENVETNRWSRMKSVLYDGYGVSKYYLDIAAFCRENFTGAMGKQYLDTLNSIDTEVSNKLDAANAYTMLMHFDSLITDQYGNQIEVASRWNGFECDANDKYQYSADLSHQNKGWTLTDYDGTERHTSRFTRSLLNTVQIFDWSTGRSKNRRLDATSWIVAANNLVHGITDSSIQFLKTGVDGQVRVNRLKEAVLHYHENPSRNMRIILDSLFTTPNGGTELAALIADRRVLSDYDLDTLKSVYDAVFNANSPTSLIGRNVTLLRKGAPHIQTLIDEFSGFIDRNARSDYLEVWHDYSDGQPMVRIKKKWFNDEYLSNLKAGMNTHVTTMSAGQRALLQQRYNASAKVNSNGKSVYSVELNLGEGRTVTLQVSSNSGDRIGIMYNGLRSPNTYTDKSNDFFNGLMRNADLNAIREALEESSQEKRDGKLAGLKGDTRDMYSLLRMIDDALDLRILTPDGIRQLEAYSHIADGRGSNSWLASLSMMAQRALFANSIYLEAGDNPLGTLVGDNKPKKTIPALREMYKAWRNNRGIGIFSNRANMLNFVVATDRDDMVHRWADARGLMAGDNSAATTKNNSGESIPNYSTQKLGTQFRHYLQKQKNSHVGSLWFVQHGDLLLDVSEDLEIRTAGNVDKAVKSMSESELLYHAIWEKMYGTVVTDSDTAPVWIQPTEYSDKTTYFNYKVRTKWSEFNSTVSMFSWRDIDFAIRTRQTLGNAYHQIAEDTNRKLEKIVRQWAGAGYNGDWRSTMHLMTEDDLVKAAMAAGEEVEYLKDYRIVRDRTGKSVVAVNPMVDFNDRIYWGNGETDEASVAGLAAWMNGSRMRFLGRLLDNSTVYTVNNGGDSFRDLCTAKADKLKSKNPVLSAIVNTYGDNRENYVNEWVDRRTGYLILAKFTDNGPDGKPFTANVLSNADMRQASASATVTLNPLLNTYYNIESFASMNLALSLTGTALNHPSTLNTRFNDLQKAWTFNKASGKVTVDLGTIKRVVDPTMSDADAVEIGNALRDAIDIDSFDRILGSGTLNVSASTLKRLQEISSQAYGYEQGGAEKAQYKRNVAVTGTVQYGTQKSRFGMAPKINCAVIRDVKAPVWNFRGDHERPINSCDGSAYMTSQQAILENRSLGSQAVGVVRKPLMHHYDPKSGTATLFKFAATVLTNESMRMTLDSRISHYKLYKKASNIQWAEGSVDLVDGFIADNFGRSYGPDGNFRSFILNGEELLYRDRYGVVRSIDSMHKTEVEIGGKKGFLYSTSESYKDGKGQTKYEEVYHLFDGNSEHYAFSVATDLMSRPIDQSGKKIEVSVQDELDAFLKGRNLQGVHTINSIFELHSALGGLDCVNGNGDYSETNHEIVANYMCAIGSLNGDPGKKNGIRDFDQDSFSQPLKDAYIGYLLNETAVKCGAKNINQAEAWYDDSALTTFQVDSDGIGPQQNADHDVIDSKITEFSQVIAACGSWGFTYDQVSELYQSLGRVAVQGSSVLVDAVNRFARSVDESDRQAAVYDLYAAVAKSFMQAKKASTRKDLSDIIMSRVQEVFDKHRNHIDDEVKLPFSDNNIYDDFVATLATEITDSSIKRRHPGMGAVLTPAYDMIQYFEVPGVNGERVKMMAPDIVRAAYDEYRNDLVEAIKAAGKSVDGLRSLEDLVRFALDNGVKMSDYYTDSFDSAAIRSHMLRTYLSRHASTAEIMDRSFFMPSDVVEVLDENGKEVVATIRLDTLDAYYAFKNGSTEVRLDDGSLVRLADGNFKYREAVFAPHNLRPSTVRWKYLDGDEEKWMNIFDVDEIKTPYINGTSKEQVSRYAVQKALDKIHAGRFTYNGTEYSILEGTLENKAAELVCSNMYKEIFGIGDESLPEIKAQGIDYFRNRVREMRAPASCDYDIAFMNVNGSSALIKFGTAEHSSSIVRASKGQEAVGDDGWIWALRGGERKYIIGKYVDDPDVEFVDGEFRRNGIEDDREYRTSEGKVQRRVDFVTVKRVASQKGEKRSRSMGSDILYEILPVEYMTQVIGSDASKIQAGIVKGIFDAGGYTVAQVGIRTDLTASRDSVADVFNLLRNDADVDASARALADVQYNAVMRGESAETILKSDGFGKAKEALTDSVARKMWVSFLDSTKFTAARIPAQAMQSFMAMDLIGWTQNSINMAYVSHFQTYLQGSDYDIDKSWLMGQNYDSDGNYVGWSNRFDYTSLKTLEASKGLPTPKGITVSDSADGANISGEAAMLVKYGQMVGGRLVVNDKATEADRVRFLNSLASAVRKTERADGRINTALLDLGYRDAIMRTLDAYEKYAVPYSKAEKAFKNSAAANIYAVSHDIRNRDQAYTAVSLDLLRAAADRSPKGVEMAKYVNQDSVTKYINQNDAGIGKNVVGIAANGQKLWMNLYNYWTTILKQGTDDDLRYLRFQTTLSRIKGRSTGTPVENVARILPDLNADDPTIERKLRRLLNLKDGERVGRWYTYVDTTLSQLISAATDNAREQVLGKINADSNLSKMFIYLTVTGYSLDDVLAFMTSPASEFISKAAEDNVYENGGVKRTVASAMDEAEGIVRLGRWVKGTVRMRTIDETGAEEYRSMSRAAVVRARLVNYLDSVSGLRELVESITGTDLKNLKAQDIMQALIQEYADGNDAIDLNSGKLWGEGGDVQLNRYFMHCASLAEQLRAAADGYDGGMDEMLADAEEFRKIYDAATELTDITTGFLSLNQGFPTDKLGVLKKLARIKSVVTNREKALGISDNMFSDGDATGNEKSAATRRLNEAVNRILDNNPTLDGNFIRETLEAAHNGGIIGSFDPVRALNDRAYWDLAKAYYEVLRVTVNPFDMMDRVPHYKGIIDCFRTYVTADQALIMKSRTLGKMITDADYMTDKDLKRAARFVDRLNILDFIEREGIINVNRQFPDGASGFTRKFDMTKVNDYDLKTEEGIAGFKLFVENDLYYHLKDKFRGNGFVEHLTKTTSDGSTVVALDIDLQRPDMTIGSRKAYNEILAGMERLVHENFNDNYTYGDLLELYNLIVNNHQWGSHRMTSLFQVDGRPNGVENRFQQFEADRDLTPDYIPDYDDFDYFINMAPNVTRGSVPFHNEPFIKELDDTWGYILKRRKDDGSYVDYNMYSPLYDGVTKEVGDARRSNHILYYPFLMPNRSRISTWTRLLNPISGKPGTDAKTDMADLTAALRNATLSGTAQLHVMDGKVYLLTGERDGSVNTALIGETDTSNVTYEKVAEMLVGLDSKTKDEIAGQLAGARAIQRYSGGYGWETAVGNATINDIISAFGNGMTIDDLKGLDDMDSYTIIRTSNLVGGELDRSGRVILPDGRAVYVIKNEYDAGTFLKYLQARALLNTVINDDGKVVAGTENAEKLESLLSQIDGFKKNRSRKEVVIEYLHNRNAFEAYKGDDGKMVVPSEILGRFVEELTGDVDRTLGKYTPFESEVMGLKNASDSRAATERAKDSKNRTVVSTDALYNVLKKWFPDMSVTDSDGKRVPVTKTMFKEMAKTANIERMREFLTGPEGLFQGHPTLQDVTIERVGGSITFVNKFSGIGQAYGFCYTSDSMPFLPVNREGVDHGKYMGMYIYERAADPHGTGATVFGISRDVMSPYGYMSQFTSLDAAKARIEELYASEPISKNSRLAMKGTNGEGAVYIEGNVRPGQIITVLDDGRFNVDNDGNIPLTTSTNNIPVVFKDFLNMTLKEFHEAFDNAVGLDMRGIDIHRLDTAEKAAAFIMAVHARFSGEQKGLYAPAAGLNTTVSELIQTMVANDKSGVIKLIDDISGLKMVNKAITEAPKKPGSKWTLYMTHDVTGNANMMDDGKINGALNDGGADIRERFTNRFLRKSMDAAINYFNEKFSPDKNSPIAVGVSMAEMEDILKENGYGNVSADTVRALVHDGRIYINTTLADASDFYHEASHLFLGALKVRSQSAYDSLMSGLKARYGTNFARKMEAIAATYTNMARPDLEEEALASLIGDELYSNPRMLGSYFNEEVYNSVMGTIFQALRNNLNSPSDSDIGFDGFLKSVLSDSTLRGDMNRRRAITNLIRSEMEKGNIEEHCD